MRKTISTVGMPVRKTQCATCVFKSPEEGGCELGAKRHEEIKLQLIKGINQICHHDDNKTICRGGRNFQLQVFFRMGVIEAETDEALKQAMERAGVK